MPLTFGDYLILQLALNDFFSDIDPNSQIGKFALLLNGKLEYVLKQLSETTKQVIPVNPEEPLKGPTAG
jgi:hypothetical protein